MPTAPQPGITTPSTAFAQGNRDGYLRRRLQRASGPDQVAILRRRRRIAKGLACLSAAAGFFGLYVLSWIVVLDL